MKLQVPSSEDQSRKRRRNTSGASSDDPTLYETPPEYVGGSLRAGVFADDSIRRSQLPHLSNVDSFDNKHHHMATPAFGFGLPPGSGVNKTENVNPLLNPPNLYGPYKTFPPQDGHMQQGLNSTLAVRNTSAAQFYNIGSLSPRASTLPARPSTSQGGEPESSSSFTNSFNFDGPASAPTGTGHLGYYLNDHAFTFDQPQLSLTSMPFGMTPQEMIYSPSQFGNVGLLPSSEAGIATDRCNRVSFNGHHRILLCPEVTPSDLQ